MKEYILFDLDGTLTDPKLGITSCVQYALHSFGIEEPNLDKLEPFIGPPLKDSFMEFYGFDEKKAEKAVAKYRERFQDTGLFENEIYPGIRGMLQNLKKRGMHLAVASSKPTVYVERILEHFKIRKYFQVVVGSELDGSRVNKDEVVQEALSQLFLGGLVEKDKVYMVGDRKFDVEGARAQGVESVGVSYGYGSLEELKEAGADYIVRSVGELQHFLYREFSDNDKGNFTKGMLPLIGPVLLLVVLKRLGLEWFSLLGGGFYGSVNLLVAGLLYLGACLCLSKSIRWYIGRGNACRYLNHLWLETRTHYLYLLLGSLGFILGMNGLMVLSGLTTREVLHYELLFSQRMLTRGWFIAQFEVPIPLALLVSVFLVPLAEEFIFRGILQNGLRERMKPWPAILGATILFALYQTDWTMFGYALLLGLLLGYAYEYFNSFYLPCVIHMLSAFFMYLLTYGSEPGKLYSWPVSLIFLVVGCVFMGLLAGKKRLR